ncbi:MAG: hypothetical protein KDC18_21190, partial [Alphaproteobacteria bacterium]|nr:hypothetical protein [Alphaproteobacteria bacterium]
MSVARPVTFSLVALALLLILGVALALQHPRFGAAPKGERLASLQGSPHYADGAFHNAVETPVLLDGESVPSIIVGNLLGRRENLRPEG